MATFDDFVTLDIRAGRVLAVEPFDRARTPAYKVRVDFGPEIGEKWSSVQARREYTPDELVGTLVIGVVNVPPKNVAGFQSEVLILGVPAEDGSLSLLTPARGGRPGGRVY